MHLGKMGKSRDFFFLLLFFYYYFFKKRIKPAWKHAGAAEGQPLKAGAGCVLLQDWPVFAQQRGGPGTGWGHVGAR